VDTDATREIVRRLYDAIGRGDVSSFGAMIHDDIDWIIYGPIEVFPFEGPRKGKAAVLEVMKEIASHYELKRYTPEIILADRDRAACLANVAFEQRAAGRTLTFKIADFLRFEDNRLIEFRELSDTFDVTQQALGRWLKL
jgi:ketosteroid isomerase-like protein